MREAAENFLAGGINEIEIPQGVLDPDGRYKDTGLDRERVKETVSGIPREVKVIATYFGGPVLGEGKAAHLARQKSTLSWLLEYFPAMRYVALHPTDKKFADSKAIEEAVGVYAELAEHALTLRPDMQLCFHNHYDSSGETSEQVSMYLDAIARVNSPALRWGPDTGHSHGMGAEYLKVFEKYAHLIGDYFHIKARVAAFDKLHAGAEYAPERDIWGNQAEAGRGLYGGFVNAADPEVQTPFKDVFRIIRQKARPAAGVVRGAMEIDNPRQHPRLEIMCEVMYMKHVHGVRTGLDLSNDEIVARVFGGWKKQQEENRRCL